MIVTIVCDVLGEENNGTTIAAMNLIRSLKQKEIEVRVLCPDQNRKGQPGFFVVPKRSLGPLDPYVAKNGVTLAKPDRKIIKSALLGADVVHLMTPFSLCVAAGKMAKRMGLPLTAGFHCQAENFTSHIFLMNSRLANKLVYRVFHRNVFRHCDAIHYPTRFICDVFEREVGPTNHYIISNGVQSAFQKRESARPEEMKGKFVILFTGRFSKEKSHRVLIEAVAKSRNANQIQLIFAGAGPLKDSLMELSRKLLPVQPIFRFFSREELIDVINYADLYVHPAEIEIEAIACLEALTCGLVPVIADSPRCATRHFALSEKNLFRTNDAGDLAAKIDHWLENPTERKGCSEAYLGYAKQFEHGRCMDRMEDMLRDAIRIRRLTVEKTKTIFYNDELNDDFAQDVSEYQTYQEYREAVVRELTEQRDSHAESHLEESLIRQAVDASDCDIPEAMVGREIDRMIQNMRLRMLYQGLKLEDYLKYTNTTEEDLRGQFRQDALDYVKTDLVLEAIGRKEGIAPSEEDIQAEIRKHSESMKADFARYRDSLNENQLENFRDIVINRKVVELIKSNADVSIHEGEHDEEVDAGEVIRQAQEALENAEEQAAANTDDQ
ncbi:MAG TPA: glycosyltransferase, partial [Bacillota bacterium]|nr:glycosyltransferase [Bacillota bacterium]